MSITPSNSKSSVTVSATDRLLVPSRESAALCGMSLRTWRTWDAAGLIPRPIRIGRSTLWRLTELKQWIACGCPDRATWEKLQEVKS